MIEKILKVLTKEGAIYLYEIINKNEIEIIMNDNEYSIYNFKRNEKGFIKVEKISENEIILKNSSVSNALSIVTANKSA